MRKVVFFFLLAFGIFGLIVPVLGNAQGLIPCGQPGNPCEFCDIFVLINNIIQFFLVPNPTNNGVAVVPLLATAFIVWGGAQILLGGANPGMLEKGKTVLYAVVIGLLIIYGGYLFISTLMSALGVAEWTGLGTWWQITCY